MRAKQVSDLIIAMLPLLRGLNTRRVSTKAHLLTVDLSGISASIVDTELTQYQFRTSDCGAILIARVELRLCTNERTRRAPYTVSM